MDMRRRGLERCTVAILCSIVAHALLLASGLWWALGEPPAPPPAVPVALVPLAPRAPEPPRLREERGDEVTPPAAEPGAGAARRPLLAALQRSRRPSPPGEPTPEPAPPVGVSGDEPSPPAEEGPPEPPEVEMPAPRDVAIRETVRDLPPPPTDAEVVEGRVTKMMRAALVPRLDDSPLMPDLRPDGQGNLVYENGALRAVIAPDGTVSFARRRGASVDGLPGKRSPDPDEQEALEQHTRLPGVPLAVREPTPLECAAGPCETKGGLGATIRPFSDLNDLMLRAHGEDPLAARKRRFLRLTQELRDELAVKAQKRAARQAKLRASRHLERLWADGSLSFAVKRLRVFRLWDECDEAASEDDDRPEAAAGQRARAQILRFIRERLPRGSPVGYSAEELRQLNGSRSSAQPFAPYLGR